METSLTSGANQEIVRKGLGSKRSVRLGVMRRSTLKDFLQTSAFPSVWFSFKI